ncbi:MAG TPA: ferredoxin family protein [Acidobacteriota bacterium]|jgi:NAD-dependent dihydropyrimidine dehydrogenase PreA subunit
MAAPRAGWITIDPDACKGCELCIEACPPRVIEMSDQLNPSSYHFAVFKGEGCTGCGICWYACPEPGTITVYKQEKAA